jgi:serine/threonine protein kinase
MDKLGSNHLSSSSVSNVKSKVQQFENLNVSKTVDPPKEQQPPSEPKSKTPSLVSEDTQQRTDNTIDNTPSQILVNSSQDVPKPNRLQRTQRQQNLLTPEMQQQRIQQRDQQLLSQTVPVQPIDRSRPNLTPFLQDQFRTLENDLRDISPLKVNGKLKEAKQIGKDLLRNPNLSQTQKMMLSTSSHQELQQEVLKTVMGLRPEKYGTVLQQAEQTYNQDYHNYQGKKVLFDQLSNLAEEMGKDGLTPQTQIDLKQQYARLLRDYNGSSAGFQTGTNGKITVANPPEAPVAPIFPVQELMKGLSKHKQELVNNIVKGIETGRNEGQIRMTTDNNNHVAEITFPDGMHLTLDRHINGGGGGQILLMKDDQDRPVILKQITNDVQTAINEVRAQQIAAEGSNGKVVGIQNVMLVNGEAYVVMDYASGGDLNDFTNKLNQAPISDNAKNLIRLSLTKDIVDGFSHLEHRDIQHRDIKFGNIYVMPDGTASIADFGEARTDGLPTYTTAGTIMGNAPEMNDNLKSAGQKAEVWGVGNLLHKLVNNTNTEALPIPNNLRFMFQFQRYISDWGRDPNNQVIPNPQTSTEHLVNTMMHRDPNQRPSFESVSQHSLFTGTDRPEIKQLITAIINNDVNEINRLNQLIG